MFANIWFSSDANLITFSKLPQLSVKIFWLSDFLEFVGGIFNFKCCTLFAAFSYYWNNSNDREKFFRIHSFKYCTLSNIPPMVKMRTGDLLFISVWITLIDLSVKVVQKNERKCASTESNQPLVVFWEKFIKKICLVVSKRVLRRMTTARNPIKDTVWHRGEIFVRIDMSDQLPREAYLSLASFAFYLLAWHLFECFKVIQRSFNKTFEVPPKHARLHRIVFRHNRQDISRREDFVTLDDGIISRETLKSPNWALYSLDKVRTFQLKYKKLLPFQKGAVFVELPKPLTDYTIDRYPFVALPFFDEAIRAAELDLDGFVSLCDELEVDQKPPRTLFFSNTARCASTLFGAMLQHEGHSTVIAEYPPLIILSVGLKEHYWNERVSYHRAFRQQHLSTLKFQHLFQTFSGNQPPSASHNQMPPQRSSFFKAVHLQMQFHRNQSRPPSQALFPRNETHFHVSPPRSQLGWAGRGTQSCHPSPSSTLQLFPIFGDSIRLFYCIWRSFVPWDEAFTY